MVCGLSPPQPSPDSASEGNMQAHHLQLRSVWFIFLLTDNFSDFTAFPWCPLVSSVPTVPQPRFILLSSASSPTTHPTHPLLSCCLFLHCGQAHSLSPIYQCIGTVAQVLICVCWFFFPVNSGCKGFISRPHSHYIK